MRLRFSIILLLIIVIAGSLIGQTTITKSFRLDNFSSAPTSSVPPSNSVSQIAVEDSIIWLGTSKGAAKSTNFGKTWEWFSSDPAFYNNGIYALATRNETVWVATGYESDIAGGGSIATGSGYAVSTDKGLTWTHVEQPLDTCIELPSSDGRKICQREIIKPYGINSRTTYTAVTTPIANVSYDVALSSGTAWVASWSSGLRKSTNLGVTWENIYLPLDNMNSLRPTDTLWHFSATDTFKQDTLYPFFDVVENDNLKAFGVHVSDDNTVWCGTAGGINKSTDNGISWQRFTNKNQVEHILSNWVIAIDEQQYKSIRRIWVSNWTTGKAIDQPEEYGVSYTEDGGTTWKNFLNGIRAYEFAFKDSIAYIATDNGLFRTANGGQSFTNITSINDHSTRQFINASQCYNIGVIGDTVFVGTGDGLASTIDNGSASFGLEWNVHRTYQQVGTSSTSYAYPNPFAPGLDVVRIHYGQSAGAGSRNVDIDIFDFGMARVKTLLHGASRSATLEYDEPWDGRNDDGKIVSNGVYFYRIKIDGNEPMYGKILVLQ